MGGMIMNRFKITRLTLIAALTGVLVLAVFLVSNSPITAQEDYRANFRHKLHLEQDGDCTICHMEADENTPITMYKAPDPENCTACHDDESIAKRLFLTNQHSSEFLMNHKFEARADENECYSCHAKTTCVDCHNGDVPPISHTTFFQSTHGIEAKVNGRTCSYCHRDPNFCIDCHKDNNVAESAISGGIHPEGFRMNHAMDARRNITTCQTCHQEGELCLDCHATSDLGGLGLSPHRPGWKNHMKDSNAIQHENKSSCEKCHIIEDIGVGGESNLCNKCHN